MSLLMRNYHVTTRYGGGFVQSIDGLSGGHEGGRAGRLVLLRQRRRRPPRARPPRTCTPAITSGGTSHDWSQTEDVPAVVGLLPRAVPQRHRRQAPARARRMRVVAGYACRTVDRTPARARGARGDRRDRQRRRAADAARAGRRLGPSSNGRPGGSERSRAGRAPSGVYARFSRRRADAHAARPGRPPGADAGSRRRADRGHAPGRRRARVGRQRAPTARAWNAPPRAFDAGHARRTASRSR